MNQKWHIGSNGSPAICRATKRPCPLGGVETHFESKEIALDYIQKQGIEKHGMLPGVELEPSSESLENLELADNSIYKAELEEAIHDEVWTEFMEVLHTGSRGLSTFNLEEVRDVLNSRAIIKLEESHEIYGDELFKDRELFEKELIKAQTDTAAGAMGRGDIRRHGHTFHKTWDGIRDYTDEEQAELAEISSKLEELDYGFHRRRVTNYHELMNNADFHRRNPFVAPVDGIFARAAAIYRAPKEKIEIDKAAVLIDPLVDRRKELRSNINLNLEEFYELNLSEKYKKNPANVDRYRDLLKEKMNMK